MDVLVPTHSSPLRVMRIPSTHPRWPNVRDGTERVEADVMRLCSSRREQEYQWTYSSLLAGDWAGEDTARWQMYFAARKKVPLVRCRSSGKSLLSLDKSTSSCT
jgi:hypothetical protein